MRLFLFVLFFCSSLRLQALNIVSWNLQWFPGHRLKSTPEEAQTHMKAAQEALKQLNPDVLIGVELRDEAAFKELVSVIPGLNVHVVSAFRTYNGKEVMKQQIGIASKWDAHSAWAEPWKTVVAKVPRGFSFAALIDPDTKKFLLVYGLHLKSNLNKNKNKEQGEERNVTLRNEAVRQLVEHMQAMNKVYPPDKVEGWIVGGDLNTNDDGQFDNDHVIDNLEAAGLWNTWKNTPKENRYTWRGEGKLQPTTFDFIFLKNLGQPEAKVISTPKETSDHLPVTVNLNLGNAPSKSATAKTNQTLQSAIPAGAVGQ